VSELARLLVAGRHLVSRRDDRPVVLRGVNRYAERWLAAAGRAAHQPRL
jgi:hypothetical protein